MTIDEEFKALIPPLSSEEYQQLEENILRDGIRDSVTYWDNNGDHILIDGHNRWEIAQKHNLPINERRMTFESRDKAKEWIILNQLGRRNITSWTKFDLVKALEKIKKAEAKSRMSDGAKGVEILPQAIGKTRDAMGDLVGVSGKTYDKMKKIDEDGSEEIKAAVRNGEMTTNLAYSMITGSQRETRQQKEAEELRNAKHRHKELAEQKAEGVVNIDAVKQDKVDSVLIFNDFKEDIRLMGNKVLTLGGQLSRNEIKDVLRCGSLWDLRELEQTLSNYASIITRTRRAIEEVYHEKQSGGAI